MAQPIYTEETNPNGIRLSDWGVDGNGILAISANTYKAGSVLGKNADGDFELTTDATKAEAVLLGDVDASSEKKNAPILLGGVVDEDMLVFGGTLTADDARDALRDKNIYLKKRG